MEKSDQKEVEYMMENPWIDIRLTEKEMNFLRNACSGPEHKEDHKKRLVGNISKSELIEDKDNWFYETVLKKLTERMFYNNWNNYRKYHIVRDESPPEFELEKLWVNYMKQHEFNPIHNHVGLYSFVVFIKIPTHWKEQHELSFSANSIAPVASDFAFLLPGGNAGELMGVNVPLSPKDEGRMLFFPASLHHQVFPFYECEEDRVTISGNIVLYDPKRPKKQDMFIIEYEEQEELLKKMEENVKHIKKKLK